MDNNCNAGGFFAGLIAGALVGGAVALLYAPQEGKATRKMIQNKAMQLKDDVADKLEDVKEEATEFKQKATKAMKAAEKELKKS